MTESELLYYYPYFIDKRNNYRHFVNDNDGFLRQFIPNYDSTETNRHEFIEKHTDLTKLEIAKIDYKYGEFTKWLDWYKNGKHIFSFSKELLEMLKKTDVSEITADKFHPPYDRFYLSLKPLNLKISNDSKEIIEGVYIDHQIWDINGETYSGYCELSLDFTGEFEKIYLEYIHKVNSQLPYNIDGIEKYDISPLGNFWNVWLWFDPKQNKLTVKNSVDDYLEELRKEIFPLENSNREVTDAELDFYNSTKQLFENTINLIINCILYLSQPTEKIDIKNSFPKGLPHNFDRKRSLAKTKRENSKLDQKIENLGFSKISFIGQSFKRQNKELFSNYTIEPHWRRGHWRNQKYGRGLNEKKLIWILPTIVNNQKEEPIKGQVYKVNE